MRLTRTQRAILNVLRVNAGKPVTGRTIHDKVMPSAGMKNVHVQIFHMRAKGVPIKKVDGAHGYYLALEGRAA